MNRVGSGYFPLGRVTVPGARLHVHWSAVALAGVMFGVWRRQPAHAIEAIASYFGLILLHEAGHAAMALRLGYRASDIHLSMIHGLCTYGSPGTLREDAQIALGRRARPIGRRSAAGGAGPGTRDRFVVLRRDHGRSVRILQPGDRGVEPRAGTGPRRREGLETRDTHLLTVESAFFPHWSTLAPESHA
jgi:hypothetical protein